MNVKDLPSKFDAPQEVEILRLDLPTMEGRKKKANGTFIFCCENEYFSVDTPYWWTQESLELFRSDRSKFIIVQREYYNDGKNGRLKYLGEAEEF